MSHYAVYKYCMCYYTKKIIMKENMAAVLKEVLRLFASLKVPKHYGHVLLLLLKKAVVLL